VGIFTDSIRIDPYYADTRSALTQTYALCSSSLSDTEKQEILAAFEGALEKAGDDPNLWLQLGQLYQEADRFEDAVAAYDEARARATAILPIWSIDYRQATLFYDEGRIEEARALAENALAAAPAESTGEIVTFLSQFGGAVIPLSEGQLLGAGEARPLAVITPTARNNYYTAYPPMIIDPNQRYDVIIITEKGEIRLRLFADKAPMAVNSFVFLATQGFYDGLTFHNVLADYIAQGGDPTGSGQGGPGYTFADELNNGLIFSRPGLLALANQQPGQNGSQFFISQVAAQGLNGRYTIFGEVIEGLEVVQSLTPRAADTVDSTAAAGDLILRMDVYEFDQ
jgi:cyclophilin family peptidyl-prolyl cis-trans isomerase